LTLEIQGYIIRVPKFLALYLLNPWGEALQSSAADSPLPQKQELPK
jgi:hypothetical protein